jgi:hypothetical protein
VFITRRRLLNVKLYVTKVDKCEQSSTKYKKVFNHDNHINWQKALEAKMVHLIDQ